MPEKETPPIPLPKEAPKPVTFRWLPHSKVELAVNYAQTEKGILPVYMVTLNLTSDEAEDEGLIVNPTKFHEPEVQRHLQSLAKEITAEEYEREKARIKENEDDWEKMDRETAALRKKPVQASIESLFTSISSESPTPEGKMASLEKKKALLDQFLSDAELFDINFTPDPGSAPFWIKA
jgi:hypothetical protein